MKILAAGEWSRGQVSVDWILSRRKIVPEVENAIERAWAKESARLGDRLFDGPMCRLEEWSASSARLALRLSRTSYKPFLGTNLHNAFLADRFGSDVLANPVGLSCVLESADGWLLLGRRNDSVAYYPNRVHPFAGALEPPIEPANWDPFGEMLRELDEELALPAGDLRRFHCIGMVQDSALRQPELVFHAISKRNRAQIEPALDPAEHRAIYSIQAAAEEVNHAISNPVLTPVAIGALTLWRGKPT
jgi:hypothetical protein